MVQRYTNESKSKGSGDREEKRGHKKLKVVELQPSTKHKTQNTKHKDKQDKHKDGKQKRGRKKLKVVELQPGTAWRWAKALNFAVFENNQKKLREPIKATIGEMV